MINLIKKNNTELSGTFELEMIRLAELGSVGQGQGQQDRTKQKGMILLLWQLLWLHKDTFFLEYIVGLNEFVIRLCGSTKKREIDLVRTKLQLGNT